MPPKDRSHYIREVKKAANRRKVANEKRTQAVDDLRQAVRRAHQAGATVMELAHVSDLSRQAVYDLLDQRPSRPA
jgi:hypothetical protein